MAFSDNLLDNILELFKVLDHVSFATSKTRFVSIIKTVVYQLSNLLQNEVRSLESQIALFSFL